jgi:hypothetical protein
LSSKPVACSSLLLHFLFTTRKIVSMRQFSIASILIFSVASAMAVPITTVSTNFESFDVGSVSGQGGWAVGNPTFFPYDQAVVSTGAGNQALRISNRYADFNFTEQTFAPRPGGIPTPASPTNGAANAGFFAGESATGAQFNQFTGSFDFRSAGGQYETGARITVSPDEGNGARQGFIGLESTAAGLVVSGRTYDQTSGFTATSIGSPLSFSDWHNLTYQITFNNGLNNDVAKIFIDNVLAFTTNSWEGYYQQVSPAEYASHPSGLVAAQTLLFRVSGASQPSVVDGFFIDNVTVQLDNVPIAAVPEPGEWAMMLSGIAVLGAIARKRRKAEMDS